MCDHILLLPPNSSKLSLLPYTTQHHVLSLKKYENKHTSQNKKNATLKRKKQKEITNQSSQSNKNLVVCFVLASDF